MVVSSKTILASLTVLAFAATAVGAESHNYVNPNPAVGVAVVDVLTCPPGTPTPEEAVLQQVGFQVGGASFCSVIPDGAGQATITIADNVVSPASGTYCQDLNANSICGEADLVSGLNVEPNLDFCGSAVLSTPIDLTPRLQWTANNWDGGSFLIFVHGPGNGNPAVSPCGLTYSGGVQGTIFSS